MNTYSIGNRQLRLPDCSRSCRMKASEHSNVNLKTMSQRIKNFKKNSDGTGKEFCKRYVTIFCSKRRMENHVTSTEHIEVNYERNGTIIRLEIRSE
ncbi:hypothetical protein THOM_1588 [Trachipleistophora hominis]|uniref:Uncharacterized protein n=1 Tax=Trachipleistophora hominis TaxID=72359 RepID=L7JXI7_TRAHO|nr:hypothetical protein THOM_1588 [Trachipleistophora hominis]